MHPLTRAQIRKTLDSHVAQQQGRYDGLLTEGEDITYRQAAVMMPLLLQGGEWWLLFTHRSETLTDHRGQVSFPGGAYERGDASPIATALREMHEEIGVRPQDVEVLGHLGEMSILTGYRVQIYIGEIPWPYELDLNFAEVESVFIVPLVWLSTAENRRVQYRSYAGREFPVIFYEVYEGHQLWGASAEMTLMLLEALGLT